MSKKEISNFDKLQAKMGMTAKNLSQMSKISQLGVSVESENLFLSENRAKVEASVTNLKAVHTFISASVTKLAVLPAVDSKKERLSILSNVIAKLDAALDQKLPQTIRKPFAIFCNEINGLYAGVHHDEIEDSQLYVNTGKPLLAAIEKSLQRQKAKLEHEDVTASSVVVSEQEHFDHARKVLDASRLEATSLESIENREYLIAKMPVIAVTAKPMSVQKLTQAGLPADTAGGYPVIRDQLVIGINTKMLESTGKVHDIAAYLNGLVAELSQKLGKPITFIAKSPYVFKKARWYWLGTEYEINALMKAAGGELRLQQWGFAF